MALRSHGLSAAPAKPVPPSGSRKWGSERICGLNLCEIARAGNKRKFRISVFNRWNSINHLLLELMLGKSPRF